MDTRNRTNNSIKVIEEYIDKRKNELPLCMGPMHSSTLPFEFPPGHRIRIINEIQDKYGGPTRYLKLAPAKRSAASCNKTTKKRRVTEAQGDDLDNGDILSITTEIRKKKSSGATISISIITRS